MLTVPLLSRFKIDLEDGVAAGRACIHFCGRSLPIIIAEIHSFLHLFNRVDHDPFQILHVEALALVFSNVEALGVNATFLLCQQVKNILLVDLEVAATDQVLYLGLVL